jgi:hypothetical protein
MRNKKYSDWSNPYQSNFDLYLLAPCLSLECKKARVSSYYRSWDIRSTLNVPFNLKWIVVCNLRDEFSLVPFSERKGCTVFKYHGSKCLKFVCLSKPIRNELFYFKAFRTSDRTLLEVIRVHECKSDVGFLGPRRGGVGQRRLDWYKKRLIF